MNIVVLMKQVPDTATQVRVDGTGTDIARDGVEYVISPYDEYALEEALRIKDAKGGGKVVLVTAGPERTQKSIRQGLAMGADEAVQVDDPAVEASDGPGLARALAAAIKQLSPDLVLTGREAVDVGRSQVPAAVAELLGWPQASDATKIEVGAGKLTVHAERGGAKAVLELATPCVVSAQKGLNEPRYASLKGIMAAKKKPIAVKKLADLGLDAAAVAPRVKVVRLAPPPVRVKSLRKFEGADAAAQAKACATALVDELKIL